MTRVIEPDDAHWPIFRKFVFEGQARGGTVTDAHLAALAHGYGAELCTSDRGFDRFRGVRLVNPLE